MDVLLQAAGVWTHRGISIFFFFFQNV
jgi:hypothetical protein